MADHLGSIHETQDSSKELHKMEIASPMNSGRTVNAFEGIILGKYNVTIIYTNHLNLLYTKYLHQRMVRWILMLEEKLLHLAGKENNAADAYSC